MEKFRMLHDPTFYVTISFILFLVAVGRPLLRMFIKHLDERKISIKKLIDQATKSREHSEKFLKATKNQQKETLEQVEAIKTHSSFEAERLKSDSLKKLDIMIARGERLTAERIRLAESKAMSDIQHDVVQIAISAAEKILEENLTEKINNQLIDEALKEIEELDFRLIGH